MSATEQLKSFSRRTVAASVLKGALKGTLRAAVVAVVVLVLLQTLDRFFPLPTFALRVLWSVGVGAMAVVVAGAFFPLAQFSVRSRSRYLQRRVSALRPDDFRLALELTEKENVPSTSLRDFFIGKTLSHLQAASVWWATAQWNWRPAALAMIICLTVAVGLRAALPLTFPFSNRFVFPFAAASWRNEISIEPGDAQVATGGALTVRVRLSATSFEAPELFVKNGRTWERRTGESDGARVYSFPIDRIVTPVVYRVRWKNEWSERFTLTPVEPLAVRGWSVKLTPPAYTGQPPREQVAPEIRGLSGTHVELKIEANSPLAEAALVYTDGPRLTARSVEGKSAVFEFVVDRTTGYRIDLRVAQQMPRIEPDTYAITLVADEAPQIAMLSPEQDIVIGENEACPITFDARDDVALGRVELVWQEQGGRSGVEAVKTYSSSLDRDLDTYEWNLGARSFRPGSVIRFRVEVYDKNTVTGPGKAASDWRIVEIRSFEREHAAIETLLEAWRDQAVAALAQATTLQSKSSDEKQNLSALSPEGQKLTAQLNTLNNNMKNLVERMEKDPLADYGVWMEHQQMQETLEHLAKNAAPSTQAALQTANRAAAKRGLDEISNELERMTALSENLSKNQKARDVLQSGEDLEQAGEDLARALEDGKLTPEAREKVNRLLEEANKQLAEIAHALQDMPQELPEDFVNQEGMKQLELGKSQSLLEQIQQAMAQGDAAKALALAQSFLDMAKKMNKQLSKAHESFTESNSAEKLASQIEEQSKELDKITEKQSQLLDQTQRIASQQHARSLRDQADKLAALAARQQAILDNTAELVRDPAWPNVLGMVRFAFEASQTPMREIKAEMQSKRLVRTGEMMPPLLGQLNAAQSTVAASSAPVSITARAKAISEEEAALWAELQKLSSAPTTPTSEEKKQSESLRGEQSALEEQTQKLRKSVQALSQKTASLGAPLMHSLGQAGSRMHDASGSLADAQAPAAQNSQEQALDELRSAQEGLQQAQSMMSQMAMEQGGEPGGDMPGGSGGRIRAIARPGGQSGSSGTNNGKVRLPTAADYRPPKAFREDLLEALKERYPKTYEDIIRQYYKRLAN